MQTNLNIIILWSEVDKNDKSVSLFTIVDNEKRKVAESRVYGKSADYGTFSLSLN